LGESSVHGGKKKPFAEERIPKEGRATKTNKGGGPYLGHTKNHILDTGGGEVTPSRGERKG